MNPPLRVSATLVASDGGATLRLSTHASAAGDDVSFPRGATEGLRVRVGDAVVPVLSERWQPTLDGGEAIVDLGPLPAGSTEVMLEGALVVPFGDGPVREKLPATARIAPP